MRARLQGGRFRQLNEALYTQPGDGAFSMMAGQPDLFKQYHDGFKEQVRGWPLQPVDAAIKWIRGALGEDDVVVDFGCGDARLGATVKQVRCVVGFEGDMSGGVATHALNQELTAFTFLHTLDPIQPPNLKPTTANR